MIFTESGTIRLKMIFDRLFAHSSLQEISKLDGCYCLTTSLNVDEFDKESVHARYKDLAMVEEVFRTCKTGQLNLRPIYVRKQDRTRGHVFVVMLSYLLIQKLREYWNTLIGHDD
jgi:transposase